MYKLSSDIVFLKDCAFNKRNGEAYVLNDKEMFLLSELDLDVKIREFGRTKEIDNLLANGIIVDDSFFPFSGKTEWRWLFRYLHVVGLPHCDSSTGQCGNPTDGRTVAETFHETSLQDDGNIADKPIANG